MRFGAISNSTTILDTFKIDFGFYRTITFSEPSTADFYGDVEKALERSEPLDSERIFFIKSFDADFSVFC